MKGRPGRCNQWTGAEQSLVEGSNPMIAGGEGAIPAVTILE